MHVGTLAEQDGYSQAESYDEGLLAPLCVLSWLPQRHLAILCHTHSTPAPNPFALNQVCTFNNGSIQLFCVGERDSGYYVITATESLGSSQFGTIVLHVSEILYEDLHFVAVFLALLGAVAAVLISLMWVCNRCAYKFQRKRRHKLKESTTEEIELQDVEC
uniref:V-set and transmembrane domain-containing protein 5-like n=1 Tax=Castor canadensis TaxID=51338 RepID=A0A8B7TXM8_CASCN|nr:V-set and transmembrane domain-containing protein 5-like [Castor canadensis]